jgi:hypothetical protein
VSRPLFIEEYGLRLLLRKEGVGVEISRAAYEGGHWDAAVLEAWERGKERKWKKREWEARGMGITESLNVNIAGDVIEWVRQWWGKQEQGI